MDGFSMLLVAATFSSAASFSLGRVPMPTAPSAVRMSAIDDAEVSAHADRMHGLDRLPPCCAHPAAPTLLPPCCDPAALTLPPPCCHPAAPSLIVRSARRRPRRAGLRGAAHRRGAAPRTSNLIRITTPSHTLESKPEHPPRRERRLPT